MQPYRIFSQLRLWQEGTRFNGSDFYKLLSINHNIGQSADAVLVPVVFVGS
jgi:hypothetical protein